MEPLEFGKHSWPTIEVMLATLSIRVDELAARLNDEVHEWNMDGLGPARGFGCRLPSGRLFALEELQTAIKFQGCKGPCLMVDAADLVTQGVESLLEEILQTLHLSRSDVAGIIDRAGEEQATRWLRGFLNSMKDKTQL